MKNLVIVRHAECGNDVRINPHGREQMQRLFQRLHLLIGGGPILVLASSAPRAMDSAEILVREFDHADLDVAIEKHEVLWSDAHHPENIPAVLDLLGQSRDRADTIMIVTHLEYASELPERFTLRESWPECIPLIGVDRGQAVLLDCVNRKYRYVRS